MTRARIGWRDVARVALVSLAFLAPTAGDIGGCGQDAEDLDAPKFFTAKESIDCRKCGECGITSVACGASCDATPNATTFPRGCYPLVHDGEVCLRALDLAGCVDYRAYMNDDSPTTPSECDFCPLSGAPDAGAGQGGSP